MKLDLNLLHAEGADGFVDVDDPAVDFEAVCSERFRDVAVGDATEQLVVFASFLGDGDRCRTELLRKGAGRSQCLELAGLGEALLVVQPTDVARTRTMSPVRPRCSTLSCKMTRVAMGASAYLSAK